jgi:hypothetical protein
MPKPETGAMQRRWGSIVAAYTVEQTKDLMRSVIAADEPLYTYSLLLTSKCRWDCPDPVFDLLDEIRPLQDRKAADKDFSRWGTRARSLLRQLTGDEPRSEELLRPTSSPLVN